VEGSDMGAIEEMGGRIIRGAEDAEDAGERELGE
jgi:hypothetical protein